MSTMASQKPKSRSPKARVRPDFPPGAVVLDVKRYGGRWIATRWGKVVAVADSYRALDAKVVRLGLEDEVIFTRVPETGDLVL